MDMNVSFTGINNVKILQKTNSLYGSYLSNDSVIKQGNRNFTDIIIKCSLSDDAAGADLTDFRETLSKCRPCYQVNCVNRNNPQNIRLAVHRQDIKDDTGDVSISSFKINDYDIMLDEREILPLFSFMARLTRKISQMTGLSEQQKFYADLSNKSIHKEACNFIELM